MVAVFRHDPFLQPNVTLSVFRKRLTLVATIVGGVYLGLSAHLLQFGSHAGGLREKPLPVPGSFVPQRADIVDRNGEKLATNVFVYDVYGNRAKIRGGDDVAEKLATAIPSIFSAQDIRSRLTQGKQGRIRLNRKTLTPAQLNTIRYLGIPGVEWDRTEQRNYPNQNMAVHLLGWTGDDGKGRAGLEQALETRLEGQPAVPLVTSLDRRVQHVLAEALTRQMTAYAGIGAAGMVMDVTNGEILAAVSLPDFDPNLPKPDLSAVAGDPSYSPYYNKLTTGTYEMGSVMKIFTNAMAFEEKTMTMSREFDATKPIYFGRHRIDDTIHPRRAWQQVPEIFAIRSSNIGTVRIVETLGAERQQAWMHRFGLLSKATLEVGGIAAPQLPQRWGRTASATISFGQGINVTPLQLTAAVAASVNGGLLWQATLLKGGNDNRPPQRVLSEETSQNIRRLMSLCVTHAEGTCKSARASGYYVGGKTGTADKKEGRGYATNKRRAFFVGAFPIYQPRYVVFAMVDEPKPNKKSVRWATGGWVAAPAVGETVQRMAPLLGMAPQDDKDVRLNALLAIPGFTDTVPSVAP